MQFADYGQLVLVFFYIKSNWYLLGKLEWSGLYRKRIRLKHAPEKKILIKWLFFFIEINIITTKKNVFHLAALLGP